MPRRPLGQGDDPLVANRRKSDRQAVSRTRFHPYSSSILLSGNSGDKGSPPSWLYPPVSNDPIQPLDSPGNPSFFNAPFWACLRLRPQAPADPERRTAGESERVPGRVAG